MAFCYSSPRRLIRMPWIELSPACRVWLEARDTSQNSCSTHNSMLVGTGVKNLQFRWGYEIRPSKILKNVLHVFKTHFPCFTSFAPYNHTGEEIGEWTGKLNLRQVNALANVTYTHSRAGSSANFFLGRKNMIINILIWNNGGTFKQCIFKRHKEGRKKWHHTDWVGWGAQWSR